MAIVGTAGHVDHGKSALVTALTGTNPDRWREEQVRGMTLDLGFAQLRLDGGGLEAGIVDVPGHERFLHNMLAGASGMDVLLLVVAADEGVKPQTREHLDIVRYLHVRRTIVVVSKIDLVAVELRDAAYARIANALRETFAREAPLLGVSSVTGEGIEELRSSIADALRELPARDLQAPAYLPIDRVFSLAGHGTVVTGTLMQGTIAVGDSLALEPSGKRARVRNIEVFGTPHARALAGSRVALNLAGIGRHEIARGEAAVSAGIEARARFAVRFTPLESALAVLRRRTPVRVHLGSAEIAGTLIFERAPEQATETSAELVLREPAIAFAGARFVLRRPSPKMLIGGGSVAGLRAEEHVGRSPAQSAVLAVLRERGLAATEISEIAQEANLREEIARDALTPLAARGDVLELRKPPAYVDGAASSELLERVLNRLEQAQLAEPWAMGVTSLALARPVGVAEALLVRVLARFVDDGRLTRRAGYYATPEHRPSLTLEQQGLFDRLVCFDANHPFVPVKFVEVAEAVRHSTVVGAARAFDTLLAGGTFVRVGDDLYSAAQIAAIRARIAEHFCQSDSLTPAQLRDAIGSSRKHVVPLLEWLDATGLTIRTKDSRALRAQL